MIVHRARELGFGYLEKMIRRVAIALLFAASSLAAQPAEEPAKVELDRDRQEHIWRIEHVTFLIEHYFGKPFSKKLMARDGEALRTYFREGFNGTRPARDADESRGVGLVTETRRSAKTSASRPLDVAGAVEHLLGYVQGFDRVNRSKTQVLFLDPHPEREGAWVAVMMLSAVGVDPEGAPIEHLSEHRLELYYEGEEEALKKPGPIIARLDVQLEVERRAPQMLMQEVTAETGIAEIPLPDNWNLTSNLARVHRYQFAVEDYDGDGWLDIAVAATNGRILLLRSQGGERFEDVAAAVGLKTLERPPGERMQKSLVGWIDLDNDGDPDLIAGTRLFRNDDGERFVEITRASGLKFELSPFGTVVADYDGDGLLDLYIVNQKGFKPRGPGKRPWVGDEEAGTSNDLWRNLGGGKFEDVSVEAGAGGGRHQTFAGVSFFLDEDAHPDLYLANDFGENVLLRNRGDGSFADVTERSGTGDFATSMGVTAGDLDNDGRSELYVANMYSKMGRRIVAHIRPEYYPDGLYEMIQGSLAGNRLYRPSTEPGRFDDITQGLGVNKVGWAFAPAMADLDGDGWLDIYATTGYYSTDREKPDG